MAKVRLNHAQFEAYRNHAEKRYNNKKSVLSILWDTFTGSNGTVRTAMPKTERDARKLERLAKPIKKRIR